MRTGLIAVVSVMVGALLGVGLTWSELRGVTNHFDLRQELAGDNAPTIARLEVEGSDKFDFGTLGHQLSGEHTFVIRNSGTGVLELSLAGLSCGQCVETEFKKASVIPGQRTQVHVTYHTRKPGPQFSERVEIATNDPTQELLQLEIRGFITKAMRMSVDELILGNVSANEPTTARFSVFGYQSDKLEVLGHELTNPEQSQYFTLTSQPLTAAEIAAEPHATAGREVLVAIKPGLSLGPINQTIRLQVESVVKQTVELPVQGTVVSDIMLVGGDNFNADVNILRFGTVPRSQGATASLKILVKGRYREQTKLSIASVDPADRLRATLGQRSVIANGAVLVYPLTVEVLKGDAIVNRLGTDQGKSGHVIIDTTHPQAKRLDLRVRFATE